MSKKDVDIFTILKKIWIFLLIGVVLIIFLFNREIAIWVTIISLVTLIIYYLPYLSFKSRMIRFMNQHSKIEDKNVAQNFGVKLDEIKEKMHKLFQSQKRKKWLIVFLSNRYIFYREDIISKFKELYYRQYNEKQIFENLKGTVNIRTRAEIKAILDTLVNLNKLKVHQDIKKLREKVAKKPEEVVKPKETFKGEEVIVEVGEYGESYNLEQQQQIEIATLVKPKVFTPPIVAKKPIKPLETIEMPKLAKPKVPTPKKLIKPLEAIEMPKLAKPKVPTPKKPIKIDEQKQSMFKKVDLEQYIKKIENRNILLKLDGQKQNEITINSDLLDNNGELIQKGWSRKLILNYNREKIKAGPLKIKEWDYYAILNHNGLYGITITVADLGFAGLLDVVWLDFKEKTFVSDKVKVLFTKGKFNLPRTSETGDIILKEKGVILYIRRKSDRRVLSLHFPGFNKEEGIKAELTLKQDINMDTMVIATPWKKNPTRFYYNQKINCMPANGTVQKGKKIFHFKDHSDKSYGVLDWGRGVWPHKNRWYWGSASGKLDDGTLIGWNIGYGFSDRSYASENFIFYNGVGHKLDQVLFHIDTKNYMKPWKFTSNDGRFEMIMEPIVDRNSKVNLLLIKSLQHQVFGFFTGYFTLDDGTKVKLNNLLGFAEEVYNKW